MGSKAKPGVYDCHAKAEADEEMFILLARDRLAPGLVLIWSALKSHHFPMAEQILRDLVEVAGEQPQERSAKVYEAMECSDRMNAWFKSRFGTATGVGCSAPSAESRTPKSESTGTTSAGDAAE